ncbi:xylulokinase [Robertmurraya massiliosenegalensis]|uniref:xylulokinase n=1 Tax=Robertmurraya TaxID=2837507 RepID=UPI0039A4258E
MKYVIGIDLGTSSVKVILVNQDGKVCLEVSKDYPLIQQKSGYIEQNPEDWVESTLQSLSELITKSGIDSKDVEGISYSGQMHGLVALNEQNQVVRNAILWNDVRTTKQCQEISEVLGEKLHKITKNVALEGFTLPKILWLKENEPENFNNMVLFLLPKDYLRFRMTGTLYSEYSDAAGTLLLNVTSKEWSKEICQYFEIPEHICPPLVESHHCVGTLLPEIAEKTGLDEKTKIFAGGADNACGAIGAGILSKGKTLCSIGTSGVVLSYEENKDKPFQKEFHFFNHGKEDAYYSMGVTLSAGFSLSWFKNAFAEGETFEELVQGIENVPAGSNGLLFTPYLFGERSPHADSLIRGSFIGVDGSHVRQDFVRAIMEGITFSLNESIESFRAQGKTIRQIVSIGGGAKNDEWLKIQADIFNAEIIKLENEQGPAMGAAILAAYGSNWFSSLENCTDEFIKPLKVISPNGENVERYKQIFNLYKSIYGQTKEINTELKEIRKNNDGD